MKKILVLISIHISALNAMQLPRERLIAYRDQQIAKLSRISLEQHKNQIWDYAPSILAASALAVNNWFPGENVTEFSSGVITASLTLQVGVIIKKYCDNRLILHKLSCNSLAQKETFIRHRRDFLTHASVATVFLALAPGLLGIFFEERPIAKVVGKVVAGFVNFPIILCQTTIDERFDFEEIRINGKLANIEDALQRAQS